MNFPRKKVAILLSLCATFFVPLILLGKSSDPSQRIERLQRASSNLQIQRQRTLRAACTALGLDNVPLSSLDTSRLDHLIVDDVHKLIYCFVPKVASTNWKRVFLALRSDGINPLDIMANKSHDPTAFRTLSQFSPEQINHRLQRYLKFLFVRHPYERLLSAYRNKFEKAWNDYFIRRFGRKIIKKYRQSHSHDSLDVTFEEFLRYVADLDISEHKAAFNEHWRPVSDLCFPCLIRYDVIGMYDTLVQDSDFVLLRAGLFDKVFFPRRNQTYSSEPTALLIKSYYKNISLQLLHQLEEVYEADLNLFMYDKNYPPF